MLSAWEDRSPEQQALFNPAFSAALLCTAVRAFEAEREASSGMPLLASYLVLPIALHADSRSALPATTITALTRTIGLAPELLVGLADRVACLRPYTSEGIRFAIAGGILRLSNTGELRHVPRKPRGLSAAMSASTETAQCEKVATDLGRWFARAPDTVFLFRLFRLRP